MSAPDETSGSAPVKAKSSSGYVLALIPVSVALILGALVLPRATPPEDVPLPRADQRVLTKVAEDDRAMAASVQGNALPGEVRALGTAVRVFNALQAQDWPDEERFREAKHVIDEASARALSLTGVDGVRRLRAFQLEAFLTELRTYERTGTPTTELAELTGSFLRGLTRAGWRTPSGHVLMDEAVLRVAYKVTWNAVTSMDARELQPGLDEQRALFAFYLTHPRPAEGAAMALEAARRDAKNPAMCATLEEGEHLAAEAWRLEKVKKLAELDKDYPGAFAMGVAQYRRGSYAASAESFRTWLRAHPDGPYALRARDHLLAALRADNAATGSLSP